VSNSKPPSTKKKAGLRAGFFMRLVQTKLDKNHTRGIGKQTMKNELTIRFTLIKTKTSNTANKSKNPNKSIQLWKPSHYI